jgi:hypothetical protein
MQNYKVDCLNYNNNGQVRSDCADIIFINTGTSSVIINAALILAPGQSFTFAANAEEIDRTIYTYSFSGAGTNSITVFRKVYI